MVLVDDWLGGGGTGGFGQTGPLTNMWQPVNRDIYGCKMHRKVLKGVVFPFGFFSPQ